ncbi:MAG: thiamine-phosphate kinase [Candidatus Omnitrophota bacterium]
MKLKNIGEFGLIARIAGGIKTDRSVVKGIGDDCAVMKWTAGKYLLATVDMLIEDRHFRRSQPPELVGWKAVCCGVSDIAAMGGVPRWALISCGLPKELPLSYTDGLYRGINKAARAFGLTIVGGDTNESEKVILDVTVLGEAAKKEVVTRDGARAGDFIFVTGRLGGSIKGRHLRFTPRLAESRLLVKKFKVNAMIDISDGLSSDLGHILDESRVGALIYEDLLPCSKEGRTTAHALSDGEDFELLFTMSAKEAFRLMKARETLFDIPVTRIGMITPRAAGANLVDAYGRKRALRPAGFRHF